MKLPGKVMVWVVLMAVAAPVVLAYVPGQIAQPAACHEHGQKVPAPSPVSYQCCRAGHQFAAVRELVNLRAAFVLVSRVVELGVTSAAEVAGQNQSRPLDPGSPGVTALRI